MAILVTTISFKLNKYERSLLRAVYWELDSMVVDSVSCEIKRIVETALMSGSILKTDLESLMSLIPQLNSIPLRQNSNENFLECNDDAADWPEWTASNQAKHKQKIQMLQQQLSNWLFIQCIIYQKQVSPKSILSSSIRSVYIRKVIEKAIEGGPINGIKF